MRISDWSSDVCSSDLDKDDPTRPPPEGQPGEIIFFGPQVMQGYWNRPDADVEVFLGKGLRTGDVGLIDEDGYIRIVDRLKDMIAVGGFKVFPSQIEEILYHHPRSEEHTSELQSLMRISYAVFCLKKKKKHTPTTT